MLVQPTVKETVKQAAVMAYTACATSARPLRAVLSGLPPLANCAMRCAVLRYALKPCFVGAARFDFLVTVGRLKKTGKERYVEFGS